ncbi:hypothetical protein RHMOL_Rhmol02G0064600 [Rhododendron molle]|uniref:Uncharacterized protein n=1 Tax=Rhododendron molle TaxID=49168 RepID=A0ACC0PPJ7_RHOML|nr:hypothetical protein RHMOL_Rhmol02G0064600 [Rhododendron molle]
MALLTHGPWALTQKSKSSWGQVLLISVILLAFQVAARELAEIFSALNPYHKMDRELIRGASGDVPWGHNP